MHFETQREIALPVGLAASCFMIDAFFQSMNAQPEFLSDNYEGLATIRSGLSLDSNWNSWDAAMQQDWTISVGFVLGAHAGSNTPSSKCFYVTPNLAFQAMVVFLKYYLESFHFYDIENFLVWLASGEDGLSTDNSVQQLWSYAIDQAEERWNKEHPDQ